MSGVRGRRVLDRTTTNELRATCAAYTPPVSFNAGGLSDDTVVATKLYPRMNRTKKTPTLTVNHLVLEDGSKHWLAHTFQSHFANGEHVVDAFQFADLTPRDNVAQRAKERASRARAGGMRRWIVAVASTGTGGLTQFLDKHDATQAELFAKIREIFLKHEYFFSGRRLKPGCCAFTLDWCTNLHGRLAGTIAAATRAQALDDGCLQVAANVCSLLLHPDEDPFFERADATLREATRLARLDQSEPRGTPLRGAAAGFRDAVAPEAPRDRKTTSGKTSG